MKRNYQELINALTDEQISEYVNKMEIKTIIHDYEAAFDIAGTCCGLVKKISTIPVLGDFAVNVNVLCNLFVACCKKEYCIPTKDMTILAGALAYVALPMDLIPDFIPHFGFMDDEVVVIGAYHRLKGVIADYIEYVREVNMADFMREIRDEYDKRRNDKEHSEENQEV